MAQKWGTAHPHVITSHPPELLQLSSRPTANTTHFWTFMKDTTGYKVQPDLPQDVSVQIWHNKNIELGRILDHLQETHVCIQQSDGHSRQTHCTPQKGAGQQACTLTFKHTVSRYISLNLMSLQFSATSLHFCRKSPSDIRLYLIK